MKNIHILPTDKPSRLIKSQDGVLMLFNSSVPNWFENNLKTEKQNVYLINDEAFKEGDYVLFNNIEVVKCNYSKNGEYTFDKALKSSDNHHISYFKKIILTTDPELIKNGVQAIDDEFLEWFVKNPSCEWVETYSLGITDGVTSHHYKYEIIIPKKEPDYTALLQPVGSRQETLEEAAENYVKDSSHHLYQLRKQCFLDGYKLAQERSYSKEEVLSILQKYRFDFSLYRNIHVLPLEFSKWFEQFKKK